MTRRTELRERGTRAWIDPKTGEVHGSGSGAGGGNPGEDFDDDPVGGGGSIPSTVELPIKRGPDSEGR